MAISLFDDPDVGRGRPAHPEALDARLRRLGLRDVDRIHTHTNRTVILSLRRRVLRLHLGFTSASDEVLAAIVRFLSPRVRREARRAAERLFLAFPVHEHAPPRAPRRRATEAERPGDRATLDRLAALHDALNRKHFHGRLATIPIRLSGRMRTRLGEIAVDLRTGRPDTIAISRRHLRAHGWDEVEQTLLHEMVHQWQAETGAPLDHGPAFRAKAREVGVVPRAKRPVATARNA